MASAVRPARGVEWTECIDGVRYRCFDAGRAHRESDDPWKVHLAIEGQPVRGEVPDATQRVLLTELIDERLKELVE